VTGHRDHLAASSRPSDSQMYFASTVGSLCWF